MPGPPLDDGSRVPAVTRAVAVLDLVAGSASPLGISAIARHLQLPKSSVANLCATLSDAGMLQPRSGGFALGQRLAQLGAAYLAGVDEVALFHESCGRLRVGRDDTAQLALLGDGLDVLYLARRDGVYPVRLASTPGRALPASCTATGKAMLAALAPEDLETRLAGADALPRLTRRSISSVAKLRVELERIARRGYAIDREEVIEGVMCVAAAIPSRGPSGQLLAVSITMLTPRATRTRIDELARELQELTAVIAMGLGGPETRRALAR